MEHLLFYDEKDLTSPYPFIKEFLKAHPSVKSTNFENAGHERIIKLSNLIDMVVDHVRHTFKKAPDSFLSLR